MRHNFGLSVVLFALLIGLPIGAHAKSRDTSLCPPQAIRFAHYEMGALYRQGNGGIDEDILQELIKRSGCQFIVNILPRTRSWYELESGSLDMVASGVQTAERDNFAWFAPYLSDKKYVLLGPKVAAKVTTLAQFLALPQLRLGGVRSFKYSPLYDAFIDKMKTLERLEQVGDLDTMYRMFAHGRFEATIASPLAYRYYLEHYPPEGKVRFMDWDPGSKATSSLVLSKKTFSARQAKKWQTLVQEMIADGTVLKILSQHLGAEEGKTLVYKP